jgi:hypothetical protein
MSFGKLHKDIAELKSKVISLYRYLEHIGTYLKLENRIVNGLLRNTAESVAAFWQPSENDVFMPCESTSTTESTFLSFWTAKLELDIRPNDISIWYSLKKTEKMLNPTIIARPTNRKLENQF